jgi:hypothetical protein
MVVIEGPPAPSAADPYPHTGQGRDRRLRRRRDPRTRARLWRLEVSAAAAALVFVTVVLSTWPAPVPARAMPAGLSLVRSGLAIQDGFRRPRPTRDLLDRYAFNGTAHPGVGWAAVTSHGLDVGVHPHGGWQGWFAVTLATSGPNVVWHALMARPTAAVPDGVGETVFAVQSASTQRNGTINYVVVSSVAIGGGSRWEVGAARGIFANASTTVLWRGPFGADTPAAEPVTVRTDGRHRLTVWLGHQRVYSSSRLRLHDPAPFQAYLEVQSYDASYRADFTNFWVADDSPVIVSGLAPGTRVRLQTADGVATAITGRRGETSLSLPPPAMVGTGELTVTAPGGVRVFRHLHYAGGDVIHVEP